MKTIRSILIAAVGMLLPAGGVSAASITLGLYGDPLQSYSFTPAGGSGLVAEPVAPYPGHIEGTPYGLICMDFLKTANWNTNYQGSVHTPVTEVELETAYLAHLLAQVAPGTPASQFGMISMAIWQLNDPAANHVPVDPAAQPYIERAKSLYSTGLLQPGNFPDTLIWEPKNDRIQRFVTAAQGVNVATPEPGTVGLFAGGLVMLAMGIRRGRA